jgi:hypothetical protein
MAPFWSARTGGLFVAPVDPAFQREKERVDWASPFSWRRRPLYRNAPDFDRQRAIRRNDEHVVWVNWHAILLFKHGHKGGLRQKSVRILLWSGERCWIGMNARLSPGILTRKK